MEIFNDIQIERGGEGNDTQWEADIFKDRGTTQKTDNQRDRYSHRLKDEYLEWR